MNQQSKLLQHQRRLGVILSYSILAINTIISLLYTPYMLRQLGQSQYGLYQLIGSLAGYLSLLSFGLTGAYVRFYSKYKEESGIDGVNKLNSLYLFAFSIIAIIALLFGLAFSFNLPLFFGKTMTDEELLMGRVMMILMSVNCMITLPANTFTSYIAANEQFIFQRLVKLLYAVIHPVLCVVALYLGGNAIVLVVVALACTVVMTISEIAFCVKRLNFGIKHMKIQWSDFAPLFTFSFFIFFNDIINQVNWSIDKVILGSLSGTAAISIYGIAAQLNTYYLQISTTISSVFAPQVNRIVAGNLDETEKKKKLDFIFCRVGKVQTYIVVLVIIGYVFFGRSFIRLWAGPEYAESYYVGLWLMIPVVVPLVQNIGIEIQRAKNMHKTRSIVYAFIAIGNVLLSIPLCRVYGPIGCAIGTAISLIVGNILFMNWYYYKKINIDIIHFWRQELRIVPGFIIPTILGIFYFGKINYSGYLDLALNIILFTMIYGISVFLFSFETDERKKLFRTLKKFINKKDL